MTNSFIRSLFRAPRVAVQQRLEERQLRMETLESRVAPAAIGSLDPSFGTGGLVTTDFGGMDEARAVAIQPDGKIVAAGIGAGANFAVARYNPDGTLDTTFGGGDGKVDLPITIGDSGTDLAIDGKDRIVVVGFTDDGVDVDFAVVRLDPNGGLDTSFGGGDGIMTIDFGGDDRASAVAIRPDNSIVVGGTMTAPIVQANFAVAQLTELGAFDTNFSADGKLSSGIAFMDETLNDLVLDGDGNIVVVGTTDAGGTGDTNFLSARVFPDGTYDGSFSAAGGGALNLIDFGGDDEANGVAIDANGRIVVVGASPPSFGVGDEFAIARLLSTGALDPTFAVNGKLERNLGGDDVATDVAIQSDGTIVVVGRSSAGGAPTPNFVVLSLDSNGNPDTTFAPFARTFVQFGGADRASAVAIDPNGRIVVAGSTSVGNDFALARLIATVEKGQNLAVGGSLDNQASVFVPDPAGEFPAAPTALVSPFGAGTNNTRAAVADVNGDYIPDTILVTGPGVPIRFAVVSGVDNTTLLVPPTAPFAGSEDFTGGGFVSAADFNNDGRAEMVFTPDLGGGPRVTIFSLPTSGTPTVVANFFGITDDPNFRGGARSGAGDVNGDGVADVAVSAGFQGGPRIALFDGTSLNTTPTKLLNDFFAFEPELRNGAYLSIADLNGDGFGDLAFGAGPGGAPRLLAISGQQTLTAGPIAAIATPLANFFVAGNANDRGGVRVAYVDADGDNLADLTVGSGEGSPADVRAYLGKDFTATTEPGSLQDLTVFGGVALTDGVFIG